MDVKRIESVAVPTAIASLAAGAAGYMATKPIKNGEMTDEFVKYIEDGFKSSDRKLFKKADSLDKLNPLLTEEELRSFNGDANRCAEYFKAKCAKVDKALEKFARKNAEALGIKPAEGQSLTDAVKAYLTGKNAAAVKEDFLPSSMRKIFENTDYAGSVREEFAEVYDSAAKQFKNSETAKESAQWFKRLARNMKLKQAGVFAGLAGGVALVSSAIASKIASK